MNDKPRQFTVMAKPVGSLCNLECRYCYYSKKTETAGSRMSDALLEKFIRQYIEASGESEVYFTWHGGEPALAGLDFYKQAVEIQKRYSDQSRACRNNLQTNGILLNDEWCAFLAENHFDVGLSIDGIRQIHDKYRKDHQGRGTWQQTADTIKRLQSHGIQPDLLCTVTSATAAEPLAVYRTLRDFNTGWIQFIPIVRRSDAQDAGYGEMAGKTTSTDNGKNGVRTTPDSVSGIAYGKFLCAVFDEWALHDMGQLDVQMFAETLRVYSGGKAGVCWMAPECGTALILEKDGSVYSCDHFVNEAHKIGNIETTHLRELADLSVQRRFGMAKRDGLPGKCHACKWLAVCNGGCPKDRLTLTENPGLNHLCEGLVQFFSYTEPAMKLINTFRRQGLAPDEIMSRLRSMLREKWKGVGRNDACPCGSGLKAKNCCWAKRV